MSHEAYKRKLWARHLASLPKEMTDELKPCPFCGSVKAELRMGASKGPHGEEFVLWEVMCPSCLAVGPRAVRHHRGDAETAQMAADKWNARW